MNAMSRQRRPFDGVLEIARFNWPRYAVAVGAMLAVVAVVVLIPLPHWTWFIALVAALPPAFWLAASLLASHVIYDRSRLRDWR